MTLPAPQSPPEVLLEHAGWVRRLARSLVADAHQADDLAQEALARALERPPRVGEPLRGWLATVLRNLAAQGRRGAGRRAAREAAAARPERTAAADELVLEVTTQRDVVDAVLQLEEPYRSTLLLRFFEELSPRRIAARQGVPVATVKTRLARGRELLRARLDQRHGGDGRAWLAALIPLARPPAGQLVPALASALPRTTHLVLGALIVNAKTLLLVLAVALVGALAVVALRPDEPSRAASPTSAATDTAAAELAAPLVPTAPVEDAPTAQADARTAVPARAAEQAPAGAGGPGAPAEEAVRGRVVDLASTPVAGVSVRLGAEPGRPAARTGADGSFRLVYDGGGGTLSVDDPRWTTVLAGMPVREASGQEAIVVAAPRLALLGNVVDAASSLPVEEAHVRIELPEDFRADFALNLDHSVGLQFTADTDLQGEFELPDAPLCPEARLVCGAAGFLPHEEPLPLAEGGRRVIALERAPLDGHVLRGRVVDLRGAPVAGARVSLGIDVVEADAQGEFSFDLAAPERFTVQWNSMAAEMGAEGLAADTLLAIAPGALPARFTAPRSPATGAPVWPAFVTLRLGAEPLAIAGTVVDGDGEPVAGARVWLGDPTFFGGLGDPSSGGQPELVHVETLLAGAEGVWNPIQTDERGGFLIEGLMERDYTLEAMVEDTLLRAVVPGVAAGREHVVIELPEAEVFPELSGTVVGNDGEPLQGVHVFPMCDAFRLRVEGNVVGTHHAAAARVTTDEEGRFLLANVPRNLVYLRFEGPEVLPLEWGRDVEGGLFELVGERASELVITVARRCHFQVELADPAEADAFELLDAAGTALSISEFAGNSRRDLLRQPLVEGRSNPMAAPDNAATLVLYRAGEEVRRAPVHLLPGERVTLRP